MAYSNLAQRLAAGESLGGTFLNLGSAVTAEIAADSGFDWLMLDLEHGLGDIGTLVGQLQAIAGSGSAPLVRIPWHDPVHYKRVLDAGAAGVMVPYVSDAETAREAVAAMRYPPAGIRGAATYTRASRYGRSFEDYAANANTALLTIVQVETAAAVDNADDIAAVDGVDVLFVGPRDLTINLGIPGRFEHPDYRGALQRVVAACSAHGKAAGILVDAAGVAACAAEGFRFIGAGSESGALVAGFSAFQAALTAVGCGAGDG
ncbi:MAG: hypothetical protein HKO62_10025 [Gammaproteobacteria bacterium]|nr:hypothetical protein [Gammaproteobacteria bacterium]